MSEIRVISEAVGEVLKKFRSDISEDLVTLREAQAERDADIEKLVVELNHCREELRLSEEVLKAAHTDSTQAVDEKIACVSKAIDQVRAATEENLSESATGFNEKIKGLAEELEKYREELKLSEESLKGDTADVVKLIDEKQQEVFKQAEASISKRIDESVKDIEDQIEDLDDYHKKASGDVARLIEKLSGMLVETETIHAGILVREQLLEAKQWQDRIYREGDVVTHNIGQYFTATKDTQSEPGTDDTWKRVGHSGLRFTGPLKKDHTYEVGDMYVSDGSTFLTVNDDEHRIIATRGAKGARGAKGIPGEDGKDGIDGIGFDGIETSDTGIVFNFTDGKSIGIDVAGFIADGIKQAQIDIRKDAKKAALQTVEKLILGIFPEKGEVLPVQRFHGGWRDGKTYNRGDMVRTDDGLYLARQTSKGEAPGGDFLNPTRGARYWDFMVPVGGGGGGVGDAKNVASPFNVVTLNTAIPTTGAGNGDTYYSFQDNLLHIWDDTNKKWVIPDSAIGVSPNDADVQRTAGAVGELRWSIAEKTLWVHDGTSWAKSSGGIKHVADTAARLAYTVEYPGELVVQEDDGSLWHWMSPPGGGARQWIPVMPRPVDNSILRSLVWDPMDPNIVRWRDERDALLTVADDATMLAIPIAHLQTGKLVYNQTAGKLYEFIASPTTLSRTLADWKEASSSGTSDGVKVYNRVADLPAVTATGAPIKTGTIGFVKYHADAITPLNELFVARVGNPPPVAAPQGRGSAIMGDGSPIPAGANLAHIADITPPGGVDYGMYQVVSPQINIQPAGAITVTQDYTVYLQYSDGAVDEINIPTGNYADTTAMHPAAQLVQQTTQHKRYGFELGADGNTYMHIIADSGMIGSAYPWRMYGPFATASKPPVPAIVRNPLSWVPIAERIYRKQLVGGTDVPDPQPNDLQVTTETGHKEVKVWDSTAGRWIVIYSEDQIKAAIAAGNLFTGTVQEAGHGTVGAIDLSAISSEAALAAGDKGHYYVWVGSAGHTIAANEIGGAVSAIDGIQLSVGDWIQVAEPTPGHFQYSVIPGDLLSKATADSLFGLNTWVQGAAQTGTLVSHQGGIYKANAAILATDPAPDDPANTKWVKIPISAGVHNVPADNNLPPTAPAGDVYLVVNSARAQGSPAFYIWDTPSSQWLQIGGGATGGGSGVAMNLAGGELIYNVGTPIGTIIMWPKDIPPNGYLLADGRAFDGNRYPILYQLLGDNHTPDLRGQFIRGASGPLDNFAKHEWKTGMPKTPFTLSRDGNHHHAYNDPRQGRDGIKSSDHWAGETVRYPKIDGNNTKDAGSHTHTISGGDSETVPDHVVLVMAIKAEDIGLDKRIV